MYNGCRLTTENRSTNYSVRQELARSRTHPNADIEAAISHAEAKNWTWRSATGHAWGLLRCPWNDCNCRLGLFCQMSVWSTPRNPIAHARQLRRGVDKCIRLISRDEGRNTG